LFLQRHMARDQGLRPADLYFRRTMLLIGFGMLNAYVLLWDGDILYAYGVVGMFLFVFRNLSPRRLLVIAAVTLCVQTVMFTLDREEFITARDASAAAQAQKASGASISTDQQEAIDSFTQLREEYKPSPDSLAETVASMRGNYASVFAAVKDRSY